MLVLLIVGIEKYDCGADSSCITSMASLILVSPTVIELTHAGRQADTIYPICVHFMYIVQRTYNKEAAPSPTLSVLLII
jgi:hypothetical protein